MTYTKLLVIQVIQKSILFAWLSKGSNFSWTPKRCCVKPGFIQFKIRLFEMSMFLLNWLRRWKNVYPNGCVPDSDHKFSSLRQLKNIFLLHFFRNSQLSECNAQVFEIQVYSFHVHVYVRTKFFFDQVHIKVELLTEP